MPTASGLLSDRARRRDHRHIGRLQPLAADLYGAFPVKRLFLGFAHSSLFGAGKAVLRPVNNAIRAASTLARSVLAPDATSRNTFLHPALVSWRTCASTLWPSVAIPAHSRI